MKTTTVKIDNKNYGIMLCDVDMASMQKIMGSEFFKELKKQKNIVNQEMHSLETIAVWQ